MNFVSIDIHRCWLTSQLISFCIVQSIRIWPINIFFFASERFFLIKKNKNNCWTEISRVCFVRKIHWEAPERNWSVIDLKYYHGNCRSRERNSKMFTNVRKINKFHLQRWNRFNKFSYNMKLHKISICKTGSDFFSNRPHKYPKILCFFPFLIYCLSLFQLETYLNGISTQTHFLNQFTKQELGNDAHLIQIWNSEWTMRSQKKKHLLALEHFQEWTNYHGNKKEKN